MVKIFTDSTADLSEELLLRYDIGVIPLYIILSDKEYLDGQDISPDEIYSWSEKTKLSPKTAAPSLLDVYEKIIPHLKNGEDVILFSISSEMSTTYNVFSMAARELSDMGNVYVIDSRNLSTGVGLLALNAAKMAEAGFCAEEIIAKSELLKPKVRASFVVDSLDYLYRGGRCSETQKLAGGLLKIHPVISVSGGKMHPTRKYRGNMASVTLRYAKDMQEDLIMADNDTVFITHSGCDENILGEVYEYIKSLCRFKEIYITRAGGVISSHCGDNTLGVLYIEG